MTDDEKWHLAVSAVAEEFAALDPPRREFIARSAEALVNRKEALYGLCAGVDAAQVCAACGGKCCLSGKFHFTVVDLLVFLAKGRELFAPRFGQECCPYLGPQGCLMPAGFRPFNCIIFNCEFVESLMTSGGRDLCSRLEQELRQLYGGFENEFRNRFMGGLLMNCERDIAGGDRRFLRGGPSGVAVENNGGADGCCQ